MGHGGRSGLAPSLAMKDESGWFVLMGLREGQEA